MDLNDIIKLNKINACTIFDVLDIVRVKINTCISDGFTDLLENELLSISLDTARYLSDSDLDEVIKFRHRGYRLFPQNRDKEAILFRIRKDNDAEEEN